MLRALAWTGKTQFGDYITQLDTDPGVLHPGRVQSWPPAMLGECAQLPYDDVVFSVQEKKE